MSFLETTYNYATGSLPIPPFLIAIESCRNVTFRFQYSWTVTSEVSQRTLVKKACSQFLRVIYHHLHDANEHLSSARLKTPPNLSLGLQSVSESDSKSIAHLLIFLVIFF